MNHVTWRSLRHRHLETAQSRERLSKRCWRTPCWGRIGRKSPYLKDIHWLTYLSAPYRALIPDSAIPVLRERFGFEEYPNGAFRFILLPDPYEAFAHPDELETARQELLEAIGPALLQEVPTEVADAIGLRPPRNLH